MKRVAAALLLVSCPVAVGQTFSGLGFLPGTTSSWATDISEDGTTVVGNTPVESWRWTASGGIQGLGMIPGYTEFPSVGGVSRDGSVVAGVVTSPSPAQTLPYRWTSAGLAPLDGQSSENSVPGISGDGQTFVGGGFSHSSDTAFRWTQAAGRVSLGPLLGTPFGAGSESAAFAASYDGSVIVGFADAGRQPPLSSVQTPFRWTAATGMQAILNNGQVVNGSATDASSDASSMVGFSGTLPTTGFFLWTQTSGYHFMSSPSSLTSDTPPHISGDGSTIVVKTSIWTAATGIVPLNQWLTNAGDNFSGWSLTKVTGISYDGTVLCGEGIDPNGQREAWIATVPAPGAALPLGSVLAVASLGRVRRGTR